MGMLRNSILAQALPAVTLTGMEAMAQAASSGLEEIVVTARRREEAIQSVPIAITAFNAEQIRDRRIESNSDLGRMVPSYEVREVTRGGSIGGGSQQAFIRGLPGVSTYFAEVPNPVQISGPGVFYDLQNVQALVGPQGTLFGLNSTGGAILVEPRRPGDEFGGYLDLTLGKYSWRGVEGALNLPVVKDKLLVRFAGQRQKRDGFTENVSTGVGYDNRDHWAWRTGITLKPTESIDNYFNYNGYFSSVRQTTTILQGVNPNTFSGQVVGRAAMEAALARQQELGQRKVAGLSLSLDNNGEERHQLTNITTADLNEELIFKNIVGYRRWTARAMYDSDGTPLRLYGHADAAVPFAIDNWSQQWSEEAQLQANLFDNRLTAVIGGFLSYRDVDNPKQRVSVPFYQVGLQTITARSLDDPKARTQALFAQGTYDLGSLSDALAGLKFTAGARYTWDWRSTWTRNIAASGVCADAFADRSCTFQQAGKFKSPSWTFALDYQLDPETLVYVTSRRGYGSGAFNPTAPTAELQVVDPEFNTDIEIGIKKDWQLGNDIQARTNLSAFQIWYDNVQRVSSLVFTDASGTPRTISINLNAAKAKISGLETQYLLRFGRSFELSGFYQWLYARYSEYRSVDTGGRPVDLSGRPFGASPKHRLNVSGRVHAPVEESLGQISFQASYTYKSRVFTEAGYGTPFEKRPGFGVVDLRADWRDIAGYPVDLSVFMTNATDTLYAVGNFPVWTTLGFHAETWGEPRMWGIQLRYRFGEN